MFFFELPDDSGTPTNFPVAGLYYGQPKVDDARGTNGIFEGEIPNWLKDLGIYPSLKKANNKMNLLIQSRTNEGHMDLSNGDLYTKKSNVISKFHLID